MIVVSGLLFTAMIVLIVRRIVNRVRSVDRLFVAILVSALYAGICFSLYINFGKTLGGDPYGILGAVVSAAIGVIGILTAVVSHFAGEYPVDAEFASPKGSDKL